MTTRVPCEECEGVGAFQTMCQDLACPTCYISADVTTLSDASRRVIIAKAKSHVLRCGSCRGKGFHYKLDETYSPWPVLGWRKYRIAAVSTRVMGQRASWPDPWMTATCGLLGSSRDDDAPAINCQCGIYMAKHLDSLRHYDWTLSALVAAEGVIEHERGYRAHRVWVLAVAPYASYAPYVVRALRDWPHVAVRPSSHSLIKIYDHYTSNPDEIPAWPGERNDNGDWYPPEDHSSDEGPRTRPIARPF